MLAQLTILNGPLRGAVFPLPKSGALLLGQCLYNDIQVADRAAASYHCAFVRGTEHDEEQHVVIDLYTAEGTRVNGVRVNEAEEVFPAAGKILLQCEGSEVFYRKIELHPVGTAPRSPGRPAP